MSEKEDNPNLTPSKAHRYGIIATFDFDMGTFLSKIGEGNMSKTVVFRGDGEYENDTDVPDEEIIKVAFEKEEGKNYAPFMHAKLSLFCYESEGGKKSFKLIVGSQNIHIYDNIEANVEFEGTLGEKRHPLNAPIVSLLKGLLPFIKADQIEKRSLMQEAIDDLPFVSLKPASNDRDYLQSLAANAGSFLFHGPICKELPLFKKNYDELLVVAPFITPDIFSLLKQRLSEDKRIVVLTNGPTVESLLHDGFLDERFLFLKTDRFIHAKLFLGRVGNQYDLYLGSMNLTEYAVNRNRELMVEFPSLNGIEGFPSFLSKFLGLELSDVEKALNQYRPHERQGFISLLNDVTMRRDYYLHLHANRRFEEGKDLEALRYLFSAECAENVENLAKSPSFPLIPTRKDVLVNGKERMVFSLPLLDQLNLGLINYCLHEHDTLFSKNIYLHIRNRSIKNAFLRIRNDRDFSSYYLIRTDIHAFDPSMKEGFLVRSIERIYGFDKPLCDFLCNYVKAKDYRYEGDDTVHHDGPAQWTGLSLAGVLENVYLDDLDKLIESKSTLYVRVGDDILVGVKSREEAESLLSLIEKTMAARSLSLSATKTFIVSPGDSFLFLGYQIDKDGVDYNPAYLQKAKLAITNKRNHLLSYYSKKKVPPTLRLPSLIRIVNAFLAKINVTSDFQYITTIKSLKVLDDMIVDMIRIVATEKKGKGKYSLTLDQLRLFGYRSLVNSYYRYINRNQAGKK